MSADVPPAVEEAALLTDLYQLTMLQAYVAEGMHEEAVFDFFIRRLPPTRNYLVACGLDDVLQYLETVRFSDDACRWLGGLGLFSDSFLEWLAAFQFEGTVWACPEGTPVFAGEPLLQVVAPLPQAQLVETYLVNQVNFQTMVASKAARVVHAAGDRRVVDFGLRRAHGTDAGMKAARACFVAGVEATSNVLAGRVYGIPVTGTMAHSYVQAHDSELEAFRAFATTFPESILLVDTYDTLEGVRNVVRLARELGEGFRIRGVRLDSGDLATLAKETRAILDEAGLGSVEIFASGSLDDAIVAALVAAGAPIDGFGVGTQMLVSADAPWLDCAYKISSYDGRGRMKLSKHKSSVPGRKQVYRCPASGEAARDVVGLPDEPIEGRPLLEMVMEGGRRLEAGRRGLSAIREHARAETVTLPKPLLALEPSDPPYPVVLSPRLQDDTDRLRNDLAGI
ncbi:MAG: nicotinate phosphoribosyltransferase [Planctomycetota bacterium]